MTTSPVQNSYYTDTFEFRPFTVVAIGKVEYLITKANKVTVKATRISDGAPVTIDVRNYRKGQLSFRRATPEDYSAPKIEEAKLLNVWDFKPHTVFTYGGKSYFILEQKQTTVLVTDIETNKVVGYRAGQMRAKDVTFREATPEELEKYVPKVLLIGTIVELPAALTKRYKYPEDTLFVVTGTTGATYRVVQVGGSTSGSYLKGITSSEMTVVEVTKKK